MTKRKALLCRRHWTPEEDARLRELYPDTPTGDVAAVFGRKPTDVYARAQRLELRKSPAYLAGPSACRLRRGDNVGAPFRFQKGHVPQNKGLRRPGYGPGGMRATQFGQGHRPQTWVPVGTEVIDSDGYHKRKVSDDRTKASRFNWKFVHVLVWEAAHGPVPAGHAIAFVSADKSDLRIENLECVSRQQLMRRNTVHNLPAPLVQTIQLLGALHRKLNRSTHGQEQDRRPAEPPLRDPRSAEG